MPKVSVVIPALNSAAYLRECMDSIVSQTLKDIEIIPVDAGSTDGSWEIFQEYAARDSRVKPMRSDKKSMGHQYNLGIAAATGDYIGFVETDDYIVPEMYDILHSAALDNDAHWVKGDYDVFIDVESERLSLWQQNLPVGLRYLYGKLINATEQKDVLVEAHPYMWSGIYKRDFINKNNIRLNETKAAAFQDLGFTMLTNVWAHRVVFINRSLYRYRRDNSNASVYKGSTLRFITDEAFYLLPLLDLNCELLPYMYRYLFKAFDFYAALCAGLQECPQDIKEELARFSGLLNAYASKYGEALLSWFSFHDIGQYLLLNDISAYYNKKHSEKKASENRYRKGLTLFGSFPQVVIFGAGELGAIYYIFLRRMGINNVVCFCDNNIKKWGTSTMGVAILSLEDVMAKYPQAVFIIASSLDSHEINRQLNVEGVSYSRIFNVEAFAPGPAEAMGYFKW